MKGKTKTRQVLVTLKGAPDRSFDLGNWGIYSTSLSHFDALSDKSTDTTITPARPGLGPVSVARHKEA